MILKVSGAFVFSISSLLYYAGIPHETLKKATQKTVILTNLQQS